MAGGCVVLRKSAKGHIRVAFLSSRSGGRHTLLPTAAEHARNTLTPRNTYRRNASHRSFYLCVPPPGCARARVRAPPTTRSTSARAKQPTYLPLPSPTPRTRAVAAPSRLVSDAAQRAALEARLQGVDPREVRGRGGPFRGEGGTGGCMRVSR